MFSDYELIEFSEKMKKIRNILGYSRQAVSIKTGINADTLRKIETGKNIPRFETLEILSHFYKIDLVQLLNNYKSNTTVTYFYESLNLYIVNNDIPSLVQLYKEFGEWKKFQNPKTIINRSEFTQLEVFFDTLYVKYSDVNIDLDQILEKLISAIKITIPSFSLMNWTFFDYSSLELRILYCIASVLLQSNKYLLSSDILFFLIEKMDIATTTKMNYHIMLIKIHTLISYNYHMLDHHLKALNAADYGINLCQKYNYMENLPLLLSRKGVALFNLKINNFYIYLDQAVVLLEIQNNHELANNYRNINSKYFKST